MTDSADKPAWMEQARHEFTGWLGGMDEIDAARMLQMLTTHPRWLGELRATAVYGLSRDREYKTLAAQLGVSREAINKAVTAHNRRSAGSSQ